MTPRKHADDGAGIATYADYRGWRFDFKETPLNEQAAEAKEQRQPGCHTGGQARNLPPRGPGLAG